MAHLYFTELGNHSDLTATGAVRPSSAGGFNTKNGYGDVEVVFRMWLIQLTM